MAQKEKCSCQAQPTEGGKTVEFIYNPFCKFHTGPDQGYGWDKNGRPVTKLGNAVGNIAAAVIIGSSLAAIVGAVVLAFLKW